MNTLFGVSIKSGEDQENTRARARHIWYLLDEVNGKKVTDLSPGQE